METFDSWTKEENVDKKEYKDAIIEKMQMNYNEIHQKYVDLKKENYILRGQLSVIKYLEADHLENLKEKFKKIKRSYENTNEWRLLSRLANSKIRVD
jgi:predicted butyrate kinase (DUF1464 family)